MGYIFDALNRADEPDEPNKPDQAADQNSAAEPSAYEQAQRHADARADRQDDGQAADDAGTPIADALADQFAQAQSQATPSAAAEPGNAYADDELDADRDAAFVIDSDPLNDTYAAQAMESFDDATSTSPVGRIHNLDVGSIDDRLLAVTSSGSLVSEEYRSIRTGMLARWHQRRSLVHTITSATPQEGKTITSLNMGFSFAEIEDRRTIVVECDLRLPQFQKLMHLPDGPGVIGVLQGENTLEESVLQLGEHKLNILPAGGRASNNAVQLLSSPNFEQLLERLRAEYDHVIIDTPPVVELADAGIIGGHSDEVILIARMQRTPRSLIEQAIRILKSYNAPVAGAIATDQTRARHRYHYYRYGYRYHNRYYTKAA